MTRNDHAPPVDDRLHRHLRRIGADEAILKDPVAGFQYKMLLTFLDTLQAALDDEQVPAEAAAAIVDRVIYGCTPNPAVSDYLVRQQEVFAARLATEPVAMRVTL